jgi:hypothetical protein
MKRQENSREGRLKLRVIMKSKTNQHQYVVLPPISTTDLSVEELLEKTHDLMSCALRTIKSKPKSKK